MRREIGWILVTAGLGLVAASCGGSGGQSTTTHGTGAGGGSGTTSPSSVTTGSGGSGQTGGGGTGTGGEAPDGGPGGGGAGGTATGGSDGGPPPDDGGTDDGGGLDGGPPPDDGGPGDGGPGDGGPGDGGTGTVYPPACMLCHGDPAVGSPAPPLDTGGAGDTASPGVGAHQSHLQASSWHHTVACTECHVVPSKPTDPAVPTHMNGVDDLIWGPIARQGTFDLTKLTCSGVYCHGGMPRYGDKAGTAAIREPHWTTVDGSQSACGNACHTTPPGGGHPASDACETCHGSVISSFTPGPNPTAVWADPSLHINGQVELVPSALTCTTCHGDANNAAPAAPPRDTLGDVATTTAGVGAHQSHLKPANWHHAVTCAECHQVPATYGDPAVPTHHNGTDDLVWGPLAQQGTFDAQALTCTGTYCHGGMDKFPDKSGAASNRTPEWTKVDGSQVACGTSCHTTPPGGGHPASDACQSCHGDVIASFTPGPTPTAVWADASRHIDGVIDVKGGATGCTTCHGDPANAAPAAPPADTAGNTATTDPGVGAHQSHLAPSTWHKVVDCGECHKVPASLGDPAVPTHNNGADDIAWGPLAQQGTFDTQNLTCAGTYCHGGMAMLPDKTGSVSNRTPVWTTVDGSQAKCGESCHTTPPGGSHPASNDCDLCHGMVISSFTAGANPTATWADPSLHINGQVDVITFTCTSCHGDANRAANKPAPPRGTNGELAVSDPAVGTHEAHLTVGATWHRDVQCTDCHLVPSSPTHTNGVVELNFTPGQLAAADGATPSLDFTTSTCTGVYCHGSTLEGPKSGGTVSRSPVWTVGGGVYDACGTTCHTNPPGGTHNQFSDCSICHKAVIAAYNPATSAATWQDRTLHIDGVRESNTYHDLGGWLTPKNGADHHGSSYFIGNKQRDEHGRLCTECHGANLDGGPGTVGVGCDTCHSTWRSCTFCHGTPPSQNNPPVGVGGETSTGTLAVGDHAAHLVTLGFACGTCHTVPAANDVAHTVDYAPSANLTTAGHHGDVTFVGAAGAGKTTVWNVNDTSGNPISARGSCVGGCHSNGTGGPPVVKPYWAGGAWTSGCGNCHGVAGDTTGRPNTGEHRNGTSKHSLIPCSVCHPAVPGATHLDGSVETNTTATYNGRSMTITKNSSLCNGGVRCSGTCHGGECW